MVRMSGYKYLKLVHQFLYSKLPAESAETRGIYLTHHANDVYCCGSETEISRRSWIAMIIHSHSILAGNNDCMQFLFNC
jgi:hypothetical protein